MAGKRAKVQAMERVKMKQIKPGLYVKLEGKKIIIINSKGLKVAFTIGDAVAWALDKKAA